MKGAHTNNTKKKKSSFLYIQKSKKKGNYVLVEVSEKVMPVSNCVFSINERAKGIQSISKL